MAFTRQDVYSLGGDWADTILWYARGVAAMQAKALAEPTSWRFYGGIHGFERARWRQVGALSSSDVLPSSALQKTFWKQCQHGSWYFLPWHRGYVIAFEANIRAEVVKLGGPADWALPYWNYFKAGESALPPAFASPDWPDGKGNNPLYAEWRYGPNGDGNVFVDTSQVNLDALSDPDFTGVASGGSPGFGGVDTGFDHSGPVHGGVESQPHDMVHVLVGGDKGQNQNLAGLMTDPDTAGLDPIFWLHHANIDRLWQVWRQNPTADVDPTDPNWVNGPGNIGERVFAMPMPDGTTWNYKPGDLSDDSTLTYVYDDISPAVAAVPAAARLVNLGLQPSAADALEGVARVDKPKNVELVGANTEALSVSGTEARTSVSLDPTVRQKVVTSLTSAIPTPAPDRVFLNLENVTGLSDSTAFHVYVGLTEGAIPGDHPELLAGSIALFGVRKASLPDGEHGGQGLTYVLEVTKIVDALHLANNFNANTLDVRIVPVRPVAEEAQVKIGRISIFRQGR